MASATATGRTLSPSASGFGFGEAGGDQAVTGVTGMDIGTDIGMGIAMVEILLSQGGVERHNFTIFTDPLTRHVTARILIPLNDSYVSTKI